MINKNDSLGIPNYGPWYLETLPNQDKYEEFIKIYRYIIQASNSNKIGEFQGKNKRLEFINYGRTQLVFVLTIDEKRQYTLLVNQPATTFGAGKEEFDNLRKLSKDNRQNVISPLYYLSDKDKELYVTPYHYQSRCIGVESKDWGMWIPEPNYHFENFTDEQKRIINSSMVALLVKLYDEKTKRGLSKCRLDGGDFMIEKGFENKEINHKNILENLNLIAARKLIPMEFEEYVNRIRQELSGQVASDKEKV